MLPIYLEKPTSKVNSSAGRPAATAADRELRLLAGDDEDGGGVPRSIRVHPQNLGENARANSNLQRAQAHTGGIAGFAAGDHRDMADIGFSANSTLGYIRNNSDTKGVFPASDRIQSAKIALVGQYMAASFVNASAGHCETPSPIRPLTAHPLLSLPHGAQPPRGLR